jgi:glycosyltransferase involved in cell wall biosynthesis
MRVLNIMMARGRGGLENAALDTHEALSLAGCEVTTVLNASGEMHTRFPQTANVIRFQSPFAWDPTAGFRLKRMLRDHPFDVILAHGNRAARLAQKLRVSAPLILDCHTTNYSARKMIDQIDGAIVLTEHYRDVMLKAGMAENKLKLVPNAVRIGPEPQPLPHREKLIIGGLGRLVPNKGFDVLLESLVLLKAEGLSFECVIHGVDEHGSTEAFKALRDKLGLDETEVRFPGWTTDAQNFLRSLDIFCMPSRREVLSIALLEALSAGRPIICTRVPGLEDVFRNGVEGLFVDIDDRKGLADALKQLILDPVQRDMMGHAARERSRRFDIATIGLELRNALEELCSLKKAA